MSKRIRDLVPLGFSSTIQISGRIASTTPADKILYPSTNVLSSLGGLPLVIVAGAGDTLVGTFALPSGLQMLGACYVIPEYTGIIAGVSSLGIVVKESSGKYSYNESFIVTPITGVNVVTHLLAALDASLWANQFSPDIFPPVGDITIEVHATCAPGDTLTINTVKLGGDCFAAIPIQVI